MPRNQTTISVSLSADTRRLQTDLRRARFQWQKYSRNVRRDLQTAFRGVGRLAAGAAGAFAAATADALRFSDEIAKQARNAGLSADEFQRLSYAYQIAGSSQKALTKGTQQLQRNLQQAGDGLNTYVRAFERVGLSADDLISLSTANKLRTVIGALQGIDDQTVRTATSLELLGGAGRELGTILADPAGFEEAQRRFENLGGILDERLLGNAEKLNDELFTLAQVMRAQFATALLEAVGHTGNWDSTIQRAGSTVREVTGGILDGAQAVLEYRRQIEAAAIALGVSVLTTRLTAFVAVLAAIPGAVRAANAVLISFAARWAALGTAIQAAGVAVAAGAVVYQIGQLTSVIGRYRDEMDALERSTGDLEDTTARLNERLAKLGITREQLRASPIIGTIDPAQQESLTNFVQGIRDEGKAAVAEIATTLDVAFEPREMDARIRIFYDELSRFSGTRPEDFQFNPQGIEIIDEEGYQDALRNAIPPPEEVNAAFADFGEDVKTSLNFALSAAITGGDPFQAFSLALVNRVSQSLVDSLFDGAFGSLLGSFGIPGFQFGGTVPGPLGRPTLAVVHGGEEVIPAGRGGVTQQFVFNWNGGSPTQRDRIALTNAVADAAALARYQAS